MDPPVNLSGSFSGSWWVPLVDPPSESFNGSWWTPSGSKGNRLVDIGRSSWWILVDPLDGTWSIPLVDIGGSFSGSWWIPLGDLGGSSWWILVGGPVKCYVDVDLSQPELRGGPQQQLLPHQRRWRHLRGLSHRGANEAFKSSRLRVDAEWDSTPFLLLQDELMDDLFDLSH